MFDGNWRANVERGLGPIGSGLRRTGIAADHLTALGLAMAAACAIAIATGRLGLGLALLILTAVPDLLDGAVAKASGTASPRGAFFDSVADRVSDSLVLGGLAWYLEAAAGGHAAMLPFAILAASTLISYQRAKAESLGYTARGGLMERAERIILLAVGLAFSAVLVPVLQVMLVLTVITAGQRFVRVWRQASAPPARPARSASSRRWPSSGSDRPARLSTRWQTWREAAGERRGTGPGGGRWRSSRRRTRPDSRAWRRRTGLRP